MFRAISLTHRGRVAGLLLALAAISFRSLAHADEADARALYDQGAAAYDAQDFARAASLLADADLVAPNPMVLRLALGAALKAGDAVLGEDLALRADARAGTPELSTLASEAHARFQGHVGRVRISCRETSHCIARLGPTRWRGGEVHAVAPGAVDVVFEGSPREVRIVVAAGTLADLVEPPRATVDPAPGAPSRTPPQRETTSTPVTPVAIAAIADRALPPWVFWAGVVVSGGLGAATGASAFDTRARHEDFLASRSAQNQSAGESSQLRTNALFVGTLVAAAATVTVGALFTRWRHDPITSGSLTGAGVRF